MYDEGIVIIIAENVDHVLSIYEFDCENASSLKKLKDINSEAVQRPKIQVFPQFFLVSTTN